MNSLAQGKIFESLSKNYREITNNTLSGYANKNVGSIIEGFEENTTQSTPIHISDLDDNIDSILVEKKTLADQYIDEYRTLLTQYKNTPSRDITEQMENDLATKIVEIQNIANEIFDISELYKNKNTDIKTKIETSSTQMQQAMNDLTEKRNKLVRATQDRNSLVTNYEINDVNVQSLYYKYLAWTVGSLTLAGIATYKLLHN